jgi:hypothetical protein
LEFYVAGEQQSAAALLSRFFEPLSVRDDPVQQALRKLNGSGAQEQSAQSDRAAHTNTLLEAWRRE